MKGDLVPDKDHISRYCGGTQLKPNGSPSGAAFRLRNNQETYLSVNWLEYLNKKNRDEEIDEIRKIISKKLNVGTKAKISVLNVGEVRNHVSMSSDDQRKLQILHEPENGDPSHSGIHNLRPEDDLIADLIAQVIQEAHSAKISS